MNLASLPVIADILAGKRLQRAQDAITVAASLWSLTDAPHPDRPAAVGRLREPNDDSRPGR